MQLSSRKLDSGVTLIEVLVAIMVGFAIFLLVLKSQESPRHSRERANCANNLMNIGVTLHSIAGDLKGAYPWHLEASQGGWNRTPTGAGISESNHLNDLVHRLAKDCGSIKMVVCPADRRNRPSPVGSTTSSPFLPRVIYPYFIGTSPRFHSDPQGILAGDPDLLIPVAGLDYKDPGIYNQRVTITSRDVTTENLGKIGWSDDLHRREGNILRNDGSVLMRVSQARIREMVRAAWNSKSNDFDVLLPSVWFDKPRE
ncbi:MAG TPA: prepilin-type N-terminal cleavage/methylation domain-containing protein [Candidatus Limnocylindria bacterium]|nr:prepilin-type N-terminal cleavage/methylation domain-containing protein [Candidatus Limnocylindria bacterium]